MGYHKDLTGSDLHEPKGADTATAGQIYVADGLGSGSWTNSFIPLLSGTDTQWDDIVVPLINVTVPGGLTAPTFTKISDNGSGSNGIWGQGFSASVVNELVFSVQIPHRYKAGTALKPHFHWVVPDANSGNIVWGLEYQKFPYDTATTTTTVETKTVATIGAAKKQYITAFSDISGTNLVESSIITFRFYRAGNDGADTYGSVAIPLSFDLHFEVEKLGTDDEYPA